MRSSVPAGSAKRTACLRFVSVGQTSMLREKLPHHFCGTDVIDCRSCDAFRKVFAVGPGVATPIQCIENYVSILRTVRVGKTSNMGSDPRGRGLLRYALDRRCRR